MDTTTQQVRPYRPAPRIRRVLLGTLVALVALLGSGTAAPASVQAAEWNVSQLGNYSGWAFVKLPSCQSYSWIWRNNGWIAGARTQGELVYVTPWANGWYWSWTHYSDWQAIPAAYLVVSDTPLPQNDCGWPGFRG